MTARAFTIEKRSVVGHDLAGDPVLESNPTPVFGLVTNGVTRIYTADGVEWERREVDGHVVFTPTAQIPQL